MRTALLALAALAALLLVPGATACLSANGSAVAPLLDMQFPDKQKCKAPDRSDCAIAPGETFTMQGTLTWDWDVDNCEATNVAISAEPIVITFPAFPRNPSWLKLTMEPSEISIPVEQQWDLTDDQIDPATQKVRVHEQWDIKVTIERVGDPTAEELAKMQSKNGIVEVYAKAVSTETPGFQPGFAFENFRFDASEPASPALHDTPDIPAPSFGLVVLGLAGLAVALRRR